MLETILRPNNQVGSWITPGRSPVVTSQGDLLQTGKAYMSISDMKAPAQYIDAEGKLRLHNPRRIAGLVDVDDIDPNLVNQLKRGRV
jgi:hypothetical protein